MSLRTLFIQFFQGRPSLQGFFGKLHTASLYGMNYGSGADYRFSGEGWVASWIAQNTQNQPVITVFDVGANIGGYSRMICQTFPAQTQVFAFEPSARTFAALSQNISDARVKRQNIGLSDAKATLPLFTPDPLSGQASVYEREVSHLDQKFVSVETISLETLDQFCADQGIDRIDFLKMDVEGHEMSVLKGAAGMLEKEAIRFIQFEFGPCNVDSRTFFKDFFYLLSPRYHLYRVLNAGLHPITAYKDSLEVFRTANYLAVLKSGTPSH